MLVGRFRGGVSGYRIYNGAGFRRLSSLNNLDEQETLSGCLSTLPKKAKVVICGGGVMGSAVAYHLARRGWGDKTVLIEKEK